MKKSRKYIQIDNVVYPWGKQAINKTTVENIISLGKKINDQISDFKAQELRRSFQIIIGEKT